MRKPPSPPNARAQADSRRADPHLRRGARPLESPPTTTPATDAEKPAPVDSDAPERRVAEARRRRLAHVPAKYRKLYESAYTGRSRKAAMRAFCLECVGWSEAEVRLCTAPACPLWPYRPSQTPRKRGQA